MNLRFRSPFRTPLAARACLLGALFGALSCRDLERFDTHGDQAYCGDLVSGPSFQDGFLPDSQPKQLRMKLSSLETNLLSTYSNDKVTIPARLSSNDVATGLCAGQGQALFEDSPLRSIPQVDHDAIASMTFGEGHDEDFFAWTTSTCQGTMLAVISLLRNGDIELRLFKPMPPPPNDAGADERPGFALFYLQRNPHGCGF